MRLVLWAPNAQRHLSPTLPQPKRAGGCLRTATLARRRSEAMAWRFAGRNLMSAKRGRMAGCEMPAGLEITRLISLDHACSGLVTLKSGVIFWCPCGWPPCTRGSRCAKPGTARDTAITRTRNGRVGLGTANGGEFTSLATASYRLPPLGRKKFFEGVCTRPLEHLHKCCGAAEAVFLGFGQKPSRQYPRWRWKGKRSMEQREKVMKTVGERPIFGPDSRVRDARRSQPHCVSFRRGTNPSSRVGFPSPPPVSFPTHDERFAIRGACGPNLWPRHPRLFMRRLRPFMGWLAQELAVLVRRDLWDA
ncbi:MAG: hypothetical protein JWR26_1658 [Pedosphaera sp.]|nr:hypothetical protein [Pedosphaera sp.]